MLLIKKINQELNLNNAYNAFNKKNKEKEKIDLLNKSFKKKKTEGSFRKVVKKNIFNINNNKEEEKAKHVVNTDYNENHDKMSQTITSDFYDFYKNPLKKYKDLILNEGGYKKKKVENLKKEHENKGSNIINQSNRNSVYKEYKFFDNDNNEFEEEKKKSSVTPKKKKIFQKYNKLRPLITTAKKNESNNEEKNSINENKDKNIEEKNKENKILDKKEKNDKNENVINKSIVESIKLLASTLSLDGLKQIQNEVQKLLEEKSKN